VRSLRWRRKRQAHVERARVGGRMGIWLPTGKSSTLRAFRVSSLLEWQFACSLPEHV
jgi:hypothetical protein